MELKDFAQEYVKEAGLGATALRGAKRIWGGISGSTVKGIESRIGATAGDMSTKAQRKLGRLGEMLPKAKAFQRNARIGAGLAGGGLVAGHLLTSKRED